VRFREPPVFTGERAPTAGEPALSFGSMRLFPAFLLLLAGCHSSPHGGGDDLGVGSDLSGSDGALDLAGDQSTPAGLSLVVPCIDSVTEVYQTPFGLPALTPASQGDVVRCYRDTALDQDGPGVDKTLKQKGIALGSPASGVIVYRVGFRTGRANGSAGMSTARVYLPTSPRALPLPVVVAGHPSEGLGDACASSKNPQALLDVALPWAASGYAVIAPDYTGLGDETVQAYLDNRDQGYALLDGARALRKMFSTTSFSPKVVISGWSQGGGSALSAQALAKSYGAGGELAAVIAFAPEWPIRNNSFALVDAVRNPSALVAFNPLSLDFSYSNHVIWTMRAYGFFSNFSALTTDGGAAFPAASRAAFLGAMDTTCGMVALGAEVYLAARPAGGAKNSDLFDPGFLTAFVACLDDPASAACSGIGRELYDYFGKNHLVADPTGAPILLVQGLLDTVLPPPSEAACVVQKLTADGATPQVCVDSAAQHTDVTNRNIGFAISWAQARLAGTAPPGCAETAQLPPPSCN
jgi:dienelactone hydrolase